MYMEDTNQQGLHRVGALLVHGLHDSLCDMEELTGFLANYHVVTLNVCLLDCGASVSDRLPVDWSKCSSAVYKGLRKLKQRCKYVFLIGHSLGGALCLHVAASEIVTGIVMVCTPVYVYPRMLPAARFVESLAAVPPAWHEDWRRSALDEHDTAPMAPVESPLHCWSLLRTELPSVTAPFLIMTAVHDAYVVSARDAQAIYRSVGSQEKYLVKVGQSDCLLGDDPGPEEIFDRILDFIQGHAGV